MTLFKCIFFLIISAFFFSTCRKDEEADYIKKETIRGNVRNNCTGKGFANVEIKLLERHEKGHNNVEVNSYSYITDTSGDFTFKDIDIHSSSKYSYAEYIASHYSPDYTLYGIGPLEIEKSHMSVFNQIGISASFKLCTFYLPTGTTINNPDSFTLSIKQPTIHYYEPNRNWQINFGTYTEINTTTTSQIDYIGKFPMGWWQINIDKTKGGVHSVINDSIYLGMGADTSYTIPW